MFNRAMGRGPMGMTGMQSRTLQTVPSAFGNIPAGNILAPGGGSMATQAVGGARNTLGHLGWNALRGAAFMGPGANATRMGRVAAGLGTAGTIGVPLMSGSNNVARPGYPGMTVQAALKEAAIHPALIRRLGPVLEKKAVHPHLKEILDTAGLGLLATIPAYHLGASEEFKQRHPNVEHVLDLLGLGTLAADPIRVLLRRKGH